jgi:hypothetical protein
LKKNLFYRANYTRFHTYILFKQDAKGSFFSVGNVSFFLFLYPTNHKTQKLGCGEHKTQIGLDATEHKVQITCVQAPLSPSHTI